MTEAKINEPSQPPVAAKTKTTAIAAPAKPETVAAPPPQEIDLKKEFDIVGAKVIGAHHVYDGRNGQDWYGSRGSKTCQVVGVFDGCGTKDQSEVGASIGGGALLQLFHDWGTEYAERVKADPSTPAELPITELQEAFVDEIRAYGKTLGGDEVAQAKEIARRFLFTCLVTVITPRDTWLIRAGDGSYAINSNYKKLESPPSGPNYIAYLAYDQEAKKDPDIGFHIVHMPTNELNDVALGTDGEDHHIPCAGRLFIPFEQMASTKALYESGALQTYLNQLQEQKVRVSITPRESTMNITNPQLGDECRISNQVDVAVCEETGVLKDDFALVLVRRRSTGSRRTIKTVQEERPATTQRIIVQTSQPTPLRQGRKDTPLGTTAGRLLGGALDLIESFGKKKGR